MSKSKELHNFKIRDISQKDWDLFMQHCREESLKRGKTISANKRLIEMIKFVGATVDVEESSLKKQKSLFK